MISLYNIIYILLCSIYVPKCEYVCVCVYISAIIYMYTHTHIDIEIVKLETMSITNFAGKNAKNITENQ